MTPSSCARQVEEAAPRDWREAAPELCETHTLLEASWDLGVSHETLRLFAREAGLTFLPPDDLVVPDPCPIVDDDERLAMLADLYAAQTRATAQRVRGRALLAMTSRPEPAQDVAGAMARLGVA